MQGRSDYEKRAEIIVTQLKAKLYELESKALDTKLKAKEGLKELELKIKYLKSQREKLDQKFDELKNCSKDKWALFVTDFEEFIETINTDKQSFSRKAERWINNFSVKIEDLEDKAKNANEELKSQLDIQIENIKKHKRILEEKLIELKDSQDDNYQKIKEGFDENLSKIKNSISRAFDYFKK